jgi:hypothetical protein
MSRWARGGLEGAALSRDLSVGRQLEAAAAE